MLIKKLRPGDTLFIKSIDRRGRNYEEIINQWQKIVKEIKADTTEGISAACMENWVKNG